MKPEHYSIMPPNPQGDRANVESDPQTVEKLRDAARMERRLEYLRECEEREDARDYWEPRFRADTGDLSGDGLTDWERNQ